MCGGASFVVTQPDPLLTRWDVDPSTANFDVVEECGDRLGAFGLRRTDIGVTGLYFDADAGNQSLEAASDISLYLLPAADLFFLTEHLEVGAELDATTLGGGGIHKLSGRADDTYQNLPLLDGRLVVLDAQEPRDPEDALRVDPERWLLSWKIDFGDPQSGAVLQVWEGEDWVEVTDASSMYGDLPYYPPDYVAN